jgi:hypothetical protein
MQETKVVGELGTALPSSRQSFEKIFGFEDDTIKVAA